MPLNVGGLVKKVAPKNLPGIGKKSEGGSAVAEKEAELKALKMKLVEDQIGEEEYFKEKKRLEKAIEELREAEAKAAEAEKKEADKDGRVPPLSETEKAAEDLFLESITEKPDKNRAAKGEPKEEPEEEPKEGAEKEKKEEKAEAPEPEVKEDLSLHSESTTAVEEPAAEKKGLGGLTKGVFGGIKGAAKGVSGVTKRLPTPGKKEGEPAEAEKPGKPEEPAESKSAAQLEEEIEELTKEPEPEEAKEAPKPEEPESPLTPAEDEIRKPPSEPPARKGLFGGLKKVTKSLPIPKRAEPVEETVQVSTAEIDAKAEAKVSEKTKRDEEKKAKEAEEEAPKDTSPSGVIVDKDGAEEEEKMLIRWARHINPDGKTFEECPKCNKYNLLDAHVAPKEIDFKCSECSAEFTLKR